MSLNCFPYQEKFSAKQYSIDVNRQKCSKLIVVKVGDDLNWPTLRVHLPVNVPQRAMNGFVKCHPNFLMQNLLKVKTSMSNRQSPMVLKATKLLKILGFLVIGVKEC